MSPDSRPAGTWLDRPWFAPMVLLLVWISSLIAINPIAEFPTNDDFAYALTVKALVQDGRFQLTDWQSSTLVAQVLWAVPFCLIGGFSFTALRLSTLVLGLAGGFAMYALSRHLGLSRKLALFGSLLVIMSPLYVAQSNTFMTDIPFYAALLGSTYLIFRGLDHGEPAAYWMGLLLGLISVFIRQIGLGVFFGVVAAYPFFDRSWRRWITHAVVPAAIAFGSLQMYDAAITAQGQVPYVYFAKHADLGRAVKDYLHFKFGAARVPVSRIGVCSVYLGVFLAPIFVPLISCWTRAWAPARRVTLGLTGAVMAAVAAVALERRGIKMPLFGNVLDDFGMGWRSLPGEWPHAPRWLWVGILAVGVWGGVAMYALWIRTAVEAWKHRHDSQRSIRLGHYVFIFVLNGMLTGPALIMYSPFFDRYLLCLLPYALLLAVPFTGGIDVWNEAGRTARAVALVGLLLISAWSITIVHDYLEWNRTRWVAARYVATDLGIPPERFDGGFEVNNLEHFGRNLYVPGDIRIVPVDPATKVRVGATHVLSVKPIAGYEKLKDFPCQTWLPCSPQSLLLSVKGEAPPQNHP